MMNRRTRTHPTTVTGTQTLALSSSPIVQIKLVLAVCGLRLTETLYRPGKAF
jgi:hypothetical protein